MNSEYESHTLDDGTRLDWVAGTFGEYVTGQLHKCDTMEQVKDVLDQDAIYNCLVIIPPPGALAIQVGGSHYKNCKIQPIEYCEANRLGACESAVVKYITRWRDKGGLEDLNKIKHYVDLLIETEQKYHGWNKDSNTWPEKE